MRSRTRSSQGWKYQLCHWSTIQRQWKMITLILGKRRRKSYLLPTRKVELAVGDGVNWEAWAEALSVISRTDATPDQIAKAGELLHQSEGNDIVDKLRSEPQRLTES